MKINQSTIILFIGSIVSAPSVAGKQATTGYIRGMNLGCWDDGKSFCKDNYGFYAGYKEGRECYDTWDDCYCKTGYEYKNGKCEKKSGWCASDKDAWCQEISGAYAGAKYGRDCYDTYDDCQCKEGWEMNNGWCEKEPGKVTTDYCAPDGYAFCKDTYGFYAGYKEDRDCYDNWDDCYCKTGYEYKDGKCKKKSGWCASDGDSWCQEISGFYAEGQVERTCYDSYEDCQCKDGWEMKNGWCEKKTGYCAPDGNAFCKEKYGFYAVAKEGKDCYDTFNDCACVDGYEYKDGVCKKKEGWCSNYGDDFCYSVGGYGAEAKHGQECYNTWGDCKCQNDYYELHYAKTRKCEAVGGCSKYPKDFCYYLGGEAALPYDDRSCYDTFDDCYCSSGWEKKYGKCVKIEHAEEDHSEYGGSDHSITYGNGGY